jgi:hypothetical protein
MGHFYGVYYEDIIEEHSWKLGMDKHPGPFLASVHRESLRYAKPHGTGTVASAQHNGESGERFEPLLHLLYGVPYDENFPQGHTAEHRRLGLCGIVILK